MEKYYFILGFIAVIIILAQIAKTNKTTFSGQKSYSYEHKQYFMSNAEHKFFDVLLAAIGNEYFIFAQVHLPTIIEHKIKGQSWKGSFAHINGKSVDFVLCDKKYISPKLVIELDDHSHERADRQERDREVERILNEAKLPLLRVMNHGDFNSEALRQKISDKLSNPII